MQVFRVLFALLITVQVAYAQTESKPAVIIDFFDLMSDAEEASVRFNVKMTIDSEYKIKSIQPYIYLSESNTLTRLEELNHITGNMVNMSFWHPPSDNEYFVMHVKYSPRFVIDGESEAVCFSRFQAKKIFSPIRCDSQSTSEYLLASIGNDFNDGETINASVVKRMIEFESLPATQSWQNYQAIITFLLNHVAEQPNYLVLNQSGQYLHQFRRIVVQLNEHLLNRRQFSIQNLDDILVGIDHTMTNVSYRIYMTIDSFFQRLKNSLPHVHARQTFVKEFFAGINPFTLIEPESQKLANVKLTEHHVSFTKWPWFDRVSVTTNESEPYFTFEQEVYFEKDIVHLSLRPFGKRGRFSRTSLVVSQGVSDIAPVLNGVSDD